MISPSIGWKERRGRDTTLFRGGGGSTRSSYRATRAPLDPAYVLGNHAVREEKILQSLGPSPESCSEMSSYDSTVKTVQKPLKALKYREKSEERLKPVIAEEVAKTWWAISVNWRESKKSRWRVVLGEKETVGNFDILVTYRQGTAGRVPRNAAPPSYRRPDARRDICRGGAPIPAGDLPASVAVLLAKDPGSSLTGVCGRKGESCGK